VGFYVDFLDEVPSASQIKKDARALYGALLYLVHAIVGVGPRISIQNKKKQESFAHGVSWYNNMRQMAM
jgi:hypothetical protein